MRHIKMDCKNIFNTKKTHSIYHSNSLFQSFIFAILPFIQRCRVGWKLFEELSKGKGRKQPSEVSMIFHVVFVVPDIHPDTIYFRHFFQQQQKKNKKLSTLTKSFKKRFGLLKQIYVSVFSLHTSYTRRNLKQSKN